MLWENNNNNILMRNEAFGMLLYVMRLDRFYFICDENDKKSSMEMTSDPRFKLKNLLDGSSMTGKILQRSKDAEEFNFENCDFYLDKPCTVTWEITNKCNLKCPYCFVMKNSEEKFDKELINTIIKNLENAEVMRVILTGGEPFINQDKLFYILNKLSHRRFGIIISSNGTLITEDLAERIKKYVSCVQISLDGKRITHDSIKGEGSFKKTIRGIKNCKKNNILVQVNIVPTKKNINQILEIAKLCEILGVDRLQLFPLIPRGGGIMVFDEFRVDLKEIKSVYRYCQMKKERKNWNISIGLSRRHLVKGSCILIEPDGSVYSPSYDSGESLYAGNIINKSLLSMWDESEAFDKVNHLLQVNPYKINCIKYI